MTTERFPGLDLDLAPLRMIDLATASDELRTVSSILCGIIGQPRGSTGDSYNAAGRLFEDLNNLVCEERTNVLTEITARIPRNEAERRARAYVLIAENLNSIDDPLDCLKEVMPLLDRHPALAGKPRPKDALETLIAAHVAALAAFDAARDSYDPENDITGKACDATRDALLAHRPATVAEARRKAEFMAKTRTFAEWDNFDRIELIHALTPVAEEAPSPIMVLFRQWQAAIAEHETIDEQSQSMAHLTNVILPIEEQLAASPATDMRDVAAKAFVLTEYDQGPFADEMAAFLGIEQQPGKEVQS